MLILPISTSTTQMHMAQNIRILIQLAALRFDVKLILKYSQKSRLMFYKSNEMHKKKAFCFYCRKENILYIKTNYTFRKLMTK